MSHIRTFRDWAGRRGRSGRKPPVLVYGALVAVVVLYAGSVWWGGPIGLVLGSLSLIPFAIAAEFLRNGFTELENPETSTRLPRSYRGRQPISFWFDVGMYITAGLFLLYMGFVSG